MKSQYQFQKDEILYHLPEWVTILAEYFGKHSVQNSKTGMTSKLEKELDKNET